MLWEMPRFPLVPSGLIVAAAFAALCSVACSTRGTEAAPVVTTYPLGDKLTLGPVAYRAIETQWLNQLPQEPTPRVPQNRFLLLRLSAENHAESEVLIPALVLVADNGANFTELSSGEGVPDWLGILRRVKPGQTVQGNVIFDAPPQHYRLRFTDENSEGTAWVDIPLNLSPEPPPQVAIPQAGRK